ncbi:MAG: sigma-54-dependent Fis family transcriptional regulator [Phycisphaeraceae bacterium]|nr:sigma-54-dependent Fis family transcriptional regulator [Phycisphaerales bacterium]MCB9860407.1 sigma-54-dependent Fis family transcriptional regulator [Phycisphaeraceae bacterium]
MANILVIDDEENLRFSTRRALAKAGHVVAEAATADEAMKLFESNTFDIALFDVHIGEDNGIDLLEQARENGFEGAAIIMTGFGSIPDVVRAMKLGADNYLQKPVSLEELSILVQRALDDRDRKRRLRLIDRAKQHEADADQVIGVSSQWQEVVSLANRLAALPIPVAHGQSDSGTTGPALPTILILGETGSGKGVVSRHIHRMSSKLREKPNAPFVHLNCNALPAQLVESELFGHEKGAFTDAQTSREGLFEMASGGIIFLDEIGDLPLELQGKLLTVLEQGTFRRVGGNRDRHVHAMVIAATNQNLDTRVEEGAFRRDLLYRLNAFQIVLPPLRERIDDAVELLERMITRFAKQYGKEPAMLSDGAKLAIRNHTWPGNAREVVNIAQRVVMLSEHTELSASDLGLASHSDEDSDHKHDNRATRISSNGTLHFNFETGIHKAKDVERELIEQALEHTKGNVSKAAQLIGMQRSSFRYRLERYQMDDASHMQGADR